MSLGVTSPLFSSLTQGSSGAFSPLKKKKLRTENDFVKFDTPFLPKPLFFRKAKSIATPVTPAMQVSALRPNQGAVLRRRLASAPVHGAQAPVPGAQVRCAGCAGTSGADPQD